jgi:hypothetical protein
MPRPKATEGRMFASVAPREVLARLRRGVAKPQVKPLIGTSDPYRDGVPFPIEDEENVVRPSQERRDAAACGVRSTRSPALWPA